MIPPPSSCPKCGRDTHCDDGEVSRCYRCGLSFSPEDPSSSPSTGAKRSIQVPDQPCPWCGVPIGCDVDAIPTLSGAEMWSGQHVGPTGCKRFLRLWISPQGAVSPIERDRS